MTPPHATGRRVVTAALVVAVGSLAVVVHGWLPPPNEVVNGYAPLEHPISEDATIDATPGEVGTVTFADGVVTAIDAVRPRST